MESDLDPKSPEEVLPLTVRGPASGGGWFYVFLEPEWRLEVFRRAQSPTIDLPGFWRSHVVPLLADHYSLRSGPVMRLADCFRAMPRGLFVGSVVAPPGSADPHVGPRLIFGGYFPSVLDQEREKRKVITAFGLGEDAASGRLEFVESAPLRLRRQEMRKLKRILGVRVPY